MDIELIIKHFGNQKKLADLLGVSHVAVVQWKRRGLPPKQAIRIERITKGYFRARDIVGAKSVDK